MQIAWNPASFLFYEEVSQILFLLLWYRHILLKKQDQMKDSGIMRYSWNLNRIYSRGITGKGITTAVLDTGIYPHRAFLTPYNRIKGFKDFIIDKDNSTDKIYAYDDNGHGTHVSGIIAGYDSSFSGKSAMGRCPGVAPESEILSLRVLDGEGNGKLRTMIRAIDWLIKNHEKYKVRIVNVSVGMPLCKEPDRFQNILIKKVEQLWDVGLVVVVAAGNEGPGPYTVTVPGISRKVITVGALADERRAGMRRRKMYSGCGPVPGSCVVKPDVVAPASGILSCDNSEAGYIRRSGTSMAAPVVSGILALLLSAEPELTNLEVKIRLMETSRDLLLPKNQQGWGLIDPDALILNRF